MATAAAAATGKAESKRDVSAAVEAEAAAEAAEMEERAEVPEAEVEELEVPQGCEHAMMRIYPPCPFGREKIS